MLPAESLAISVSCRFSVCSSSFPNKVRVGRRSKILRCGSVYGRRNPAIRTSGFVAQLASGDDDRSVSVGLEFDVQFPRDYNELLDQAKQAAELAFRDNKQSLEIEFPTAGLGSVPGDGEGGIEMTGSVQLIREFCDRFIKPEKATRTRIFFPEAKEVEFARKSAFGGASFKLDYLTKPSLFEDFGFVTKVKMADRVKPDDEVFLVAYPYFNVNEMLVVEELYQEAVINTTRNLIIFNGELDRIRSGCILLSDEILHVFLTWLQHVAGTSIYTAVVLMFLSPSKILKLHYHSPSWTWDMLCEKSSL
eukprot:TRINITY_DN7240_c2_g1_i1.p1 TRINITY_DN7240_c2_g1~~TRINITY_DN7240_c2_g1_i1.p1  ORF type:complete len:306 (+),score=64.18 TRINITY_DN7240_c2_g1_i1:168-1085(+)